MAMLNTVTEVFEDGSSTEKWSVNDKLHRKDGPAYRHSSGKGDWACQEWRHRVDGPAVIYMGDFDEITREEWYFFVKT